MSRIYNIGRLCVKLAGRDAGKKCVVIDVLDDNYVLIDGQTRRKKCNLAHLEPLNKVITIAKNASNKDVVAALKIEGIDCSEKKEKSVKQKSDKKPRSTKQKKVKLKKPKKEKVEKKSKKDKVEEKAKKEDNNKAKLVNKEKDNTSTKKE
ncbi:MAG: 50S ribosomal protein L14e [Candidatus Woesearchaeota archaeon]